MLVGGVYLLDLWGILDYRQPGNITDNLTTHMYWAIQLFVAGDGWLKGEPPPNLQLEIARLLAPVTMAVAAFGLFAHSLWRDFILWLKRFHRGHLVVFGLGEKGWQLASTHHANRRNVIVVDSDPRNPYIERCRRQGIPTILADALDDPMTFKRVGLSRAAYLVSVCGGAGTNIETGLRAAGYLYKHKPWWRVLRKRADGISRRNDKPSWRAPLKRRNRWFFAAR